MHFRQEEPKNVIESTSKPIRIECMAIELRNVKNEQCKPVIFLANKKGRLVLTASRKLKSYSYFKALTWRVSLPTKFPALFLWITLRLANLSSIEVTSTNRLPASFFREVKRNFFIALRVVL
jgi:hypothetical protein